MLSLPAACRSSFAPWSTLLQMILAPFRCAQVLAGLIVLLHSLDASQCSRPDCGGLIVCGASRGTVLSETPRDELECIAGIRAASNFARGRLTCGCMAARPSSVQLLRASSSLLKLETFYLERHQHAVLFLDSDMLVMKPQPNRHVDELSRAATRYSIAPTRYMDGKDVEAARQRCTGCGTQPSAIQLGFHAFVMPRRSM